MNWEQVEAKWKQLTNSAKENWNKLSDEELHQISGKREQLAAKNTGSLRNYETRGRKASVGLG